MTKMNIIKMSYKIGWRSARDRETSDGKAWRLARFDKLCVGSGFPRSFLSFFAMRYVFSAAYARYRHIAAKKERVGQKASEDVMHWFDLTRKWDLRHASCWKKPKRTFEEKMNSKCKYCVKTGELRMVGRCRKKVRKIVQGAQKKAAAKRRGWRKRISDGG